MSTNKIRNIKPVRGLERFDSINSMHCGQA